MNYKLALSFRPQLLRWSTRFRLMPLGYTFSHIR